MNTEADIAVISEDRRFCRMFELELRRAGYRIAYAAVPLQATLLFWDMETVPLSEADAPCSPIWGFMFHAERIPETERALCREIILRPFSVTDLISRLRTILPPPAEATPPVSGETVLTRTPGDTSRFFAGGFPLRLTEEETRLLTLLYDNRGKPVSRQELQQTAGTSNAVDVHICHLRRKLEEVGIHRLLISVRGVGYCLGKP